MAEMYCYVKDGIKVDGPFNLLSKKSYRNTVDGVVTIDISVPYALTTQQRLDVGLWPYTDTPPEYNQDTQHLTSEDVVGKNVVTKTYTVNDYTTEQMAIRIADAKTSKLETIRGQAQAHIVDDYPSWYQSNCSLGLYPSATVEAAKTAIAAFISASNTAEDSTDAATTLAEIRAIEPIWPEG